MLPINVVTSLIIVPNTRVYRINDAEDPFDRMLAVVRFTFSKDLKIIVRIIMSFLCSCALIFRVHREAKS